MSPFVRREDIINNLIHLIFKILVQGLHHQYVINNFAGGAHHQLI